MLLYNYILSQSISISTSTLLFAPTYATNCLVFDLGTPPAIIATTLIIGCFKATMDDVAALHVDQFVHVKIIRILVGKEGKGKNRD